MRVNSVPLDSFYPVCCECGNACTDYCYKLDGLYYCEDCMKDMRIDCFKEAVERRESAYEDMRDTIYG